MDDLEEGLQVVLGEFRSKLQDLLAVEVKLVEHRIKHEIAKDLLAPQAPETKQPNGESRENVKAPVQNLQVLEPSPSSSWEVQESDTHKSMLKKSHTYKNATERSSMAEKRRRFFAGGRSMSMHSEPEFKTRSWKDAFLTVAHSPFFDLFWAFVIASNAVYLGVQLSVANEDNLMAVHVIYACLYAVELMMRLLAVGPRAYFTAPPGWAWNWLDVIVVTSSWLDIILSLVGTTGGEAVGSSFRVLRLLRVSRLLRIVKTLWIIRFVGALRTLVSSLVDTFKPLFWAMLLLFIVIYIASVLFTDVALEHLEVHTDKQMDQYFGTLGDTLQTLFRSISGGFDWVAAAEALRPLGSFWVLAFQLYIAFATFAVLNVMTGVFCHSAIKSAEQDHANRLHSRQDMRSMFQKIFARMDASGDGKLTLEEFEMMFENEAMQAFLETAEINASDAWTLFASLDVDGDHVVDADEFTKRCLTLRGPARAMDVFALTRHNLKMRDLILQIDSKINRLARDDSSELGI